MPLLHFRGCQRAHASIIADGFRMARPEGVRVKSGYALRKECSPFMDTSDILLQLEGVAEVVKT